MTLQISKYLIFFLRFNVSYNRPVVSTHSKLGFGEKIELKNGISFVSLQIGKLGVMFSLPVLAYICLRSVFCGFVSGYSVKSRSCMSLVMSLYSELQYGMNVTKNLLHR